MLLFKKPRTPKVRMYEKEILSTNYFIVEWQILGEWQKTFITMEEQKAILHFYHLVSIVTKNDIYIKEI